MSVATRKHATRMAVLLSAFLLSAAMLCCIPYGQALAVEAASGNASSADGALKEYTATVNHESTAAPSTATSSSTVKKANGVNSPYALLEKDGYVYPCNKAGKKLGKYWNIQSKVTYLYVAANCTKLPAEYKVYYKASTKLKNPIRVSLKIVNFKTASGKSSVASMDAGALKYSINLVSVKNFSKTKVTKIPEAAFSGTSITKIGLPKTLKYICEEAFYNDKKLKYVCGLNKTRVSAIGVSAFENCGAKTLAMPKTLTTIKHDAFYGMTNLTNVYGLQNTKVKAIPDYAFYKAKNLKALALPKTCKKVGKYSFAQCTKLTKLYLLSPTLVKAGYFMLAKSGIDTGASGAAIYVPSALRTKYMADLSITRTCWGAYAKYIVKL